MNPQVLQFRGLQQREEFEKRRERTVRLKANDEMLAQQFVGHPQRHGLLLVIDFNFNMLDVSDASTAADFHLPTTKKRVKWIVDDDRR